MADPTAPGLGDLLGLLGGSNPLAGISKSIAQFQRGVNDFLSAVENFNQTMEQLNAITARVNRLLDDVEPPVRALMPQVTRTLLAADQLVEQMTAPIEKVAPGLSRLADTLQSPQLNQLPVDLGEFLSTIGDLARRLQPLGQLAESAGGLFGLRPFGALRPAAAPEPAPAATASRAPSRPSTSTS
ncbi:MAG: hypothetical protein ACK5CE_14230, partial [Actinomycetes bacterium]